MATARCSSAGPIPGPAWTRPRCSPTLETGWSTSASWGAEGPAPKAFTDACERSGERWPAPRFRSGTAATTCCWCTSARLQVVVQREGVGAAGLPADLARPLHASQLTCSGVRHHGPARGLTGPRADGRVLEDEASGPAVDRPHDALEPAVGARAFRCVRHQELDRAAPLDVTVEGFRDPGARQLGA